MVDIWAGHGGLRISSFSLCLGVWGGLLPARRFNVVVFHLDMFWEWDMAGHDCHDVCGVE